MMSPVSTFLRPVLSTLLAGSIIFSSVATPMATVYAAPAPAALGGIPVPPQGLGWLSERHVAAGSKKHVVLIQDLHAHYDTQKKIAGLLGFYEQNGLLQHPVGLEGASGTWDLSLWQNFPLNERKAALYDYLLQEAGLTGPEWFSLHTQRPTLLYGIDDSADFIAQRVIYARSRTAREAAAAQIAAAEDGLKVLADRTLTSRSLQKWKRLTTDFNAGKLQGDVYLRHLNRLAETVQLTPQAETLQTAIRAQTSADMAVLATSDRFYSDLRKYSQQIALSLAPDQTQQNLINALYAADLLKRLLLQRLTFREVQQVTVAPQEMARLAHQLMDASVEGSVLDEKDLLELIRVSTDFYVAAIVRDEPLAKNALALFGMAFAGVRHTTDGSQALRPDVAVLVSGGFHTAGITEIFRQAGVSYDVITPNITAAYTPEDEERYADRMAGQSVSLARFLGRSSSEMSAEKMDIRTPQSKTANALFDPAEKVNPDDIVSMTGPASAWFRSYLASYRNNGQLSSSIGSRDLSESALKSLGFDLLFSSDEKDAAKKPHNAFRSAFLDFQDLLDEKPELAASYGRLKAYVGLRGALNPGSMSAMILDPAHVHPHRFVFRQDRTTNSNEFFLYVHEDYIKAFAAYLPGGRFHSPEIEQLLMAVFAFHESTERFADKDVLPSGALVQHKDLLAYGATVESVLKAFYTGQSTPFLNRVEKDLGIPIRASVDWLNPARVSDEDSASRFLIALIHNMAWGGNYHAGDLQPAVNQLMGTGLNNVDLRLMMYYFKTSDLRLKSELLRIRQLLFERGRVLSQAGMQRQPARIRSLGQTESDQNAISRVRMNLERWREQALAYGAAYVRKNPRADEENIELVQKSISDEINEDIYGPLLNAIDRIETLIQKNEIAPQSVQLKASRYDANPQISVGDRAARIGFLPMKGDPWQIGHVFVMLEAIASGHLDKLVIMVDNSDPDRKPDLSSLTIREPMTLELMKILEPFVVYTPISKEEEDLRTADGERSMFRLIQFNRSVKMKWFYMVGSDHRPWEVMKDGKPQPDTAKKISTYMRQSRPDGYAGEEIAIIFMERKGHQFIEGEIEKLRELSRIPDITKIFQPMDTSSTRIRKQGHWWAVPDDVFAMGASAQFWDADVDRQLLEPRSHRFVTRVWGNATYIRSQRGYIAGAHRAYQRVHEVSRSVAAYVLPEDDNRMRSIRSELLVAMLISPVLMLMMSVHMGIGRMRGWLQGKRGSTIVFSEDMEFRIRQLNAFIRSGTVSVPDISVGSTRHHALMPSRMWTHVSGYLETVRMRQNKIAYEQARRRISQSA